MYDIESANRRIVATFAELTQSSRPEVREIARAVVDGARPRDLLRNSGYSEFFHECLSQLESMSDEDRERLINSDSAAVEEVGDESRSSHDTPVPDDDDEDFSQRSFLQSALPRNRV